MRRTPGILTMLAGACTCAGLSPSQDAPTAPGLKLEFVSRASAGVFNASAAEIPSFDPVSKRVFVVNGHAGCVDVFAMDARGELHRQTAFLVPGVRGAGKVNSIAIRSGVLAVAANGADSNQAPGSVTFFATTTGDWLGRVHVGAMPDMLTFTPDGTKVVVANEGEPNSYGLGDALDPEGSISIIDIEMPAPGEIRVLDVRTACFAIFNDQRESLQAAGVRIFGPGASVAQDLEPEYIAVSADSTWAYVTLQENNALASVSLKSGIVESIVSFGLKNHALPGQGLDPSDQDGGINIRNEHLLGMFQPDAIAAFTVQGTTYLLTANEGDARAYPGFAEAARLGDEAVRLDAQTFSKASELKTPGRLGRLEISRATGDLDADGDLDQLHAFGARSISIWTTEAELVWDSGEAFERLAAAHAPTHFNASNTDNFLDSRSDAKGPEPEGVAIGQAYGRVLAFVGLERFGGIAMFDISDPASPTLLHYVNTRDWSIVPSQESLEAVGDLGPEGLAFVPQADSPTGRPLLLVGNEVSGTTTVFTIVPTATEPQPASQAAPGNEPASLP